MNKNKFLTALLIGFLGLGATSLSADVAKGQKLYQKKLKKKCGFSGAKMAGLHSQFEWEDINDEGKLLEEIQKQCPKVKNLKEKYLEHLYDFFYEYANDSGNVPSC
jgi:hypothetical protein